MAVQIKTVTEEHTILLKRVCNACGVHVKAGDQVVERKDYLAHSLVYCKACFMKPARRLGGDNHD